VRAARLAFDAWRDQGFAPAATDEAGLRRAFAAYEGRLRQYRAVLGAHGLPVHDVDVGAGDDARAALR
jgi:hypothetical protein